MFRHDFTAIPATQRANFNHVFAGCLRILPQMGRKPAHGNYGDVQE
jgi:hypothetical protein